MTETPRLTKKEILKNFKEVCIKIIKLYRISKIYPICHILSEGIQNMYFTFFCIHDRQVPVKLFNVDRKEDQVIEIYLNYFLTFKSI